MTEIEQRLFDEFDHFEKFSQYITKADASRIAARIVLEVAERSYRRGVEDVYGEPYPSWVEEFKKELLG